MATATHYADGTRRLWAMRGNQRADYIEICLADAGEHDPQVATISKGHLADADIQPWVEAKRRYSDTTGGLRMLILDRHRYESELPLAEATFAKLLQVFKLSSMTHRSFNCSAGMFSKSYCVDDQGDLTGISTMKMVLHVAHSLTGS